MQSNSPINPGFDQSTVTVNGNERFFYLAGNADAGAYPNRSLPILLFFPGGGKSALDILNTTGLGQVNALAIAFQGQNSKNTFTFANAFPWLLNPPLDDVRFVKTVLQELPAEINGVALDKTRLFASGKSDGMGFCVYLAAFSPELGNGFTLKAVAGCSGAYFGTGSVVNFGTTPNETICLPHAPSPILELHGTNDGMMPYEGRNFDDYKATQYHEQIDIEYWLSVDPTVAVNGAHERAATNTYTAKVFEYWQAWAEKHNYAAQPNSTLNGQTVYNWASAAGGPVVHIRIDQGTHVWYGQEFHSEPPTKPQPADSCLDATQIVCHFFEIARPGYTPPAGTAATDPSKLPTYRSELPDLWPEAA